MAKFNDKISTLINNQLPDFVVDEHPQFAQFLKLYFTFMESAMLQVDGIESTDGITLENETGRTDNLLLDGSKIKNYNLKNCILSKNTILINDEINIKILENKII